jgi:hypothetical protein
MRKIAYSLPIALGLILPIAVAHDNPNDDTFVQHAIQAGLSGAPTDLITNGHAVCSALDSGNTPDTVRDAFVSQLHFQRNPAARSFAAAVAAYCPQHGNLKFQTSS